MEATQTVQAAGSASQVLAGGTGVGGTGAQAGFAAGSEYLTFTLGAEEYGVDILRVQEIRGYEAVTKIANTPEFIKGVVNLRGVIVPIVDLRIRFGQAEPKYDQFTVVIVLNVMKRVVGIVVDGVSDVTMLTAEQIRPAPEFGTLDTKYVTGLGTVDKRMLILVDMEKLLSSEDMQLFEKLTKAA